MARCGFKNGHRKNKCLIEIGVLAQNMLTILESIVNLKGETYIIFQHEIEFSFLTLSKNIHTGSKHYNENDHMHNLDLIIISH